MVTIGFSSYIIFYSTGENFLLFSQNVFDQYGSFWQLSFAQFDSFWAHGAHCMVVLIDPIPVPLMFHSVKQMYGINLYTLTMINYVYFQGLQS